MTGLCEATSAHHIYLWELLRSRLFWLTQLLLLPLLLVLRPDLSWRRKVSVLSLLRVSVPDSVPYLKLRMKTTAPFDRTCFGFYNSGIFPCSCNITERSEFSQWRCRNWWLYLRSHHWPLHFCWRTTSPGVSSSDRSTGSRTFWPRPRFSVSSLMRTGSKTLLFITAVRQTPLKC